MKLKFKERGDRLEIKPSYSPYDMEVIFTIFSSILLIFLVLTLIYGNAEDTQGAVISIVIFGTMTFMIAR